MSQTFSAAVSDDVADTLFVPLYLRHLETLRPNGIIHDPLASRLVEHIDYDFSRYDSGDKSRLGTAIRVRCFDRAVAEFIRTRKDPVVVSLGAGLDTRFQRVYDGKGVFYELDLPEVIELRRQFLPESEANPYIAQSMFETDWIGRIVEAHPSAEFILVAEGVFMYFDEARLRPLFHDIAEGIPRGELHFDAVSPWMTRNQHRHDTMSKARARFLWGLTDDHLPETWSPRLRLQSTTLYMNEESKRWGVYGVVARHVPFLRTAFRMLHYGVGAKAA